MGGLACVAVLLSATLAGAAGSREGVAEEVVHEVGEQLHALFTLADAASDGPDAVMLPAFGYNALDLRPASTEAGWSTGPSAPRAPWRAHSAARGPPARA
jgi:hypothetical protein